MTNLLLRLFTKGGDFANEKVRCAIGKLSGAVGIVANVLLFALKLVAGLLSGSVAITADAMNNLSDASSSIVTLVGFRLAEKPADADHPYGHARYEYLSALAVAAMIVVIGFELGKTSVEKILSPEPVSFSALSLVILLSSIAVKLWLWRFNRALGTRIGSSALLATATDSRNDCISTAAVLLAGFIQHLTHWNIDGFMGLAVALFILYSGAMLGKQTISPLLGESTSPELRELIVDYVSAHPKVLGYHDLMVHDYGPGQRFASLHVEMDQRCDPLDCHDVIDDLERECLQSHNIHLVIHYDPVVTDDPELNRFQNRATELLRQFDPRLCHHDFRMVRSTGHTNLVFDVSLPPDLEDKKLQIRHYLERELSQAEGMPVYAVITYDPLCFNE
ncbi:MAG: cation transporter [Oscillospiraceae bacterium]|nr:cation transporter [Oscillospiraceae bacterium]